MLEPLDEKTWFLNQTDNSVGYGVSITMLTTSPQIIIAVGWVNPNHANEIIEAMILKDFGSVMSHEQVKELITCLQYIDHMMENRNATDPTQ